MTIAVGSDHAGYELKEQIKNYLLSKGFDVLDVGASGSESCDYPVFGRKAALEVASGRYERGIIVCGTGVGISIAANRVRGIRCVVGSDTFSVVLSRSHNNSNMLALGARVLGGDKAIYLVEQWLGTPYDGGRHEKRVKLLDE